MRVAIFGARAGSLGDEVRYLAQHRGHTVRTYGPNGEDVRYEHGGAQVWRAHLGRFVPEAVLVTVGVNMPVKVWGPEVEGFEHSMLTSFDINVMAPLDILRSSIDHVGEALASVAIVSSNSAQIARRGSVAYCSSKAALSMAIRCAARELEGAPLVYGYELGLLRGTPMTNQTERQFGPTQTRIPGVPEGLHLPSVAETIVLNLENPGAHLNGALLRMDGGEQ